MNRKLRAAADNSATGNFLEDYVIVVSEGKHVLSSLSKIYKGKTIALLKT